MSQPRQYAGLIVAVWDYQNCPATFTAFDLFGESTEFAARLDQLVAQSLMIPLAVVVLDVLRNRLLQ